MRELSLNNQKPATRNRFKKERRKMDMRGFLKKTVRLTASIVVVSMVVLVAYELYGFLGRTTFLRLDRIEVSGLKRLKQEEILAAASVRVGEDLLSLRLPRMGEQLAKNPWIESVRVRRNFPHTLSISVVEREPVGVVSMGYLYYLDGKGEIFKPLQEGDSLDFPVITGLTEEDIQRDPSGSKETLKVMLGLLDQLRRNKSGITIADISELHYDKGFGYTLFTINRGLPIRLGMNAFNEKLVRLSRVYNELQPQITGLEYIDLDYNDRIVVKKT
ncbi:MAG TPA: FtsQ-type POTRA domain-containing protein [Geobacteraceae bacterium]|nr:FtsQ-type POTRA domain-containing protein [Geobacteraceae bacterium]